MSDMREEEIRARDVQSGQAGRHSRETRVRAARLDDRIGQLAIKELTLRDEVGGGIGSDPYVPFAVADGEMGESTQGETARPSASAVAVETVGDKHGVRVLLESWRQVGFGKAGRQRFLHPPETNGDKVVGVMKLRLPSHRYARHVEADTGRDRLKYRHIEWTGDGRAPLGAR